MSEPMSNEELARRHFERHALYGGFRAAGVAEEDLVKWVVARRTVGKVWEAHPSMTDVDLLHLLSVYGIDSLECLTIQPLAIEEITIDETRATAVIGGERHNVVFGPPLDVQAHESD